MRTGMWIRSGLIGSGLILLSLFNNCSDVNFGQANTALKSLGDGHYEFDADLQLKSEGKAPLDIVWVIDNSGSMTEEIAHVQANFETFVNSVSGQTSLQMALLSQSGTSGNAIQLPAVTGPQLLQIDKKVGSTDSLRLSGAALCSDTSGLCSSFRNNNVQGQLASFLRSDSKKVFVFVTDDESSIPGSEFLGVFGQAFPGQVPTIYGFVGLGKNESPCQAKTGERYVALAQETRGKFYNICDQDWSASFSNLVQSVVNLTVPKLQPPHALSEIEIIEVLLDGQTLAANQYSINDDGIAINLDLLEANRSYKVKIRYLVPAELETAN